MKYKKFRIGPKRSRNYGTRNREETGLSESLTGRFEEIRVPHWNYHDSKRAFGFDLSRYLTYGGYPGSYAYVRDYARWHAYVKDAIIETVIGKDILSQRTVAKPALFRQAFAVLSQTHS